MRGVKTLRRVRRRRIAAFLGHAPALWVLYRQPVPKRLRFANLLAVATTAGAMAAVYLLGAPRWKLRGILAAWLVGHLGWGAYLAYRIGEDS